MKKNNNPERYNHLPLGTTLLHLKDPNMRMFNITPADRRAALHSTIRKNLSMNLYYSTGGLFSAFVTRVPTTLLTAERGTPLCGSPTASAVGCTACTAPPQIRPGKVHAHVHATLGSYHSLSFWLVYALSLSVRPLDAQREVVMRGRLRRTAAEGLLDLRLVGRRWVGRRPRRPELRGLLPVGVAAHH